MMTVKLQSCLLPISRKLLSTIQKVINDNVIETDTTSITINFRDSTYSSKTGGYHPVEISLQKDALINSWDILYITDFSYYGHPYAELIKELDFDIENETFLASYCSPRPITHHSVREVFQIWQLNFLSYLEFDAFDQIKVSAW